MRGDFSRVSFRSENHYSGVLLQQGRVQLDAEFNEQVAIEAHRDRATARDVIGRAGAPLDGGGFAITSASMLRGVAAGDDAWAVGEDGTVLRSAGGTAEWTISDIPAATGRLNAVHLEDGTTGWVVGDGGEVLRLSGTAWTPERPDDVTAGLYGVYSDANGAWAVGSGGTVLGWDGSEWQRQAQAADVTATLRAVHFSGDSGVAVGDDGTILATTNRGVDWTVQGSPEGAGDLHGVFLAGPTAGWAVGEQGTLLSFDGTAWTAHPLSPRLTATLRAVALIDADNGVAVGDGGTTLALVGGTWQADPLASDADLRAVAPLPDGGLLAAGDDVTLTTAGPGHGWTTAPDMPSGAEGRVGRTLAISAGDIYVGGVRCQNERTVAFGRQPEPPLGSAAPEAGEGGSFGVVLHVQEELLTATEREDLREVALGGPDSATRTRTVWQAALVALPEVDGAGTPTCADVAGASPPDGPRGRLRARAVPAAVSTSECVVPPNGGYRRLENQLYRIEIHAGTAAAGGATYTWSRDNGSVIARLEDVTTGADATDPTGSVKVSHTGRDAAVGFAPGQVVELTDQGRLLRGDPGVLAKIGDIIGTTLVLAELETVPLTMADFPVNPIVRRWDGRGSVKPGEWTELEDGVFVEFAEGPVPGDAFRTGDYWTIPARTLSGRVEWPQSGGIPRFEARQGPRRHTTPLATADIDAAGVWTSVRDCRRRFPPLTNLVHLYYVGGDGQEVMPPTPLAQGNLVPLDRPLEVGVANGAAPMAGAIVDFEVVTATGAGKVLAPGGTPDDAAPIVTDASGIATCEWQLDGATRTQVVEARFRDPLGQSAPQVIRFTAQLSAAEWVSYDGSGCNTLAGSKTVDSAIKTLARITRIFPLSGSGEDVRPGESVDVKVLVADECGPVEGATVAFARGERGSGTIDPAEEKTAANGVASCRWTPDAETPTQDLTATITDIPGPGVLHVPDVTRFVANLSVASDTTYSPPESCPEMDGVATVQNAIDRLAGLLPRLYHVSGDGLEAPVGATVELRAGIGNRCGAGDPQVRFQRLREARRRRLWEDLTTVAPDAEGIATCPYEVTDEARQLLRAELIVAGKPVGYPVYFTVSPATGDPGSDTVPAARVEVSDGTQPAKNVTRTLVEFREAPAFDTDGLFDPADDRTALRASRAGTYLATGEVEWDKTSGTGYRGVEIMLREQSVAHVIGPPLPRDVFTSQEVTTVVRMEAGDIVQLAATQSSADALIISAATLSLAWLGP